jgi:hypothetical protein
MAMLGDFGGAVSLTNVIALGGLIAVVIGLGWRIGGIEGRVQGLEDSQDQMRDDLKYIRERIDRAVKWR